MTTPPEQAEQRRKALHIVGALVGVAALAVIMIMYVAHAQRVSDSRWCELMISLDDRYQRLENPNEDAQKLAAEIHSLRQGLHCPSSATPSQGGNHVG